MIKEQEARRKKQREEEKRKLEEAAAKGSQKTNEIHGEARLLEKENGVAVEVVVEKREEVESQTTTHNSSRVGVPVNGDGSIEELKEDKNTVSGQMESSEDSTILNDGHESHESRENQKVHTKFCFAT